MSRSSSLSVLLWCVSAVVVGVLVCQPIVDPDLFWHVTVGRWIISNGEVPHVDYWNMFAQGQPWRAYSWLPEILFAACDRVGGIPALLMLKLILLSLFGICVSWAFLKLSGDGVIGLLFGAYVTAATYNHFTLRPQIIVWILFAIGIARAQWVQEKGKVTFGDGVIFAVLLSLWSNTHLTQVIGVVAFPFWVVQRDRSSVKLASVVFSCSLIGTFLTPHIGSEWLTFFSKSSHPLSHRMIAEFRPATILQYSTGFLLLLFVINALLYSGRSLDRHYGKLFMGLVLSFGALAVVKFLPFAFVFLGALSALGWRERRVPHSDFVEGIWRLRGLVLRTPREGGIFLLMAVGVAHCFGLFQAPLNEAFVPKREMDFILNHNLPFPILNDFGRGGYILYRTSDSSGNVSYGVPIDGRTNVVPPSVWEAFLEALHGRQDWRRYLDLVQPKTVLWPNESALTSLLLQDEQWCRVVQTGNSQQGYSVFVLRDHPVCQLSEPVS